MNKNYNITYSFFMFFYFLYCTKTLIYSMSIEHDDFTLILKEFFNLLLLVFSFSSVLFIQKKKDRFLFILFCVFALGCIALGNKSYFNYIITLALLVLAIQLPWKQLIESVFFTYLGNILLLVILNFFVSERFMLDDRFGLRFTAGFENPNTFSLYIIIIYSVTLLYLEKSNISKGALCIASFCLYAALFYLIYLSYSRTGMALLSLFFIGHLSTLFIKGSRSEKNRKSLFYFCLILICCIATFQFVSIDLFKTSRLIEDINIMLSGRVWHAYNLKQNLGGPTAFGMDIDGYLPIDFYFVNVTYSLGYVFCFLFALIILKKLYKVRVTSFMAVSLMIFTLLTLTESYFSVLFYSTALLIVFHRKE